MAFGKIEWSVFMGSAIIVLHEKPDVAFVLRAVEAKEGWARRLTDSLGFDSEVAADKIGGVLPGYSTVVWRDEALGTGLAAVELNGWADGLSGGCAFGRR